jgi:hypothetical protein
MSEINQNSKTDVSPLVGPLENPDTSLIHRERASFGHVKSWLSVTLSRKNLMALTGLFLCLFLVVQLFGNLQLLLQHTGSHTLRSLHPAQEQAGKWRAKHAKWNAPRVSPRFELAGLRG